MQKLLLLILITLSGHICFGQYDATKINKKAVGYFNMAQQRAEDGNYTMAAGLLQQAIEADNNYVDAYLALAGIYGSLKNYNKSIAHYEKTFQLDSNYTIDYKALYAAKLAGVGEFKKALSAVNELLQKKAPKNQTALEKVNRQKRNYEFAVNYMNENKTKSYVFAPENLGDSINSPASEYWPYLSIDGSELVFTRKLKGDNEDFFYSKKNKGQWQNAKPAEGNINTPQSEAAQTLSTDGKWMIYSANGRKDSYGNYDLYMAQLTKDGWEDTYHFGGKINSDQWESQPSLSPDNKDLYFSSRRLGGYGGIDIYVSRLKPNGYYGEPENLGPNINTAGDDQCPFIHTDNQTLYFTSNNWPGYGDDDLFYSNKLPNGEWTKPTNLGYPINTIDKEGTLFIAADGKTAYYTSDRSGSKGGFDIYSFELPESVRPTKTLWVKGKITDKKTGQGLPASLELIDLASNNSFSSIKTDEDGYYLMTLPVGKDYVFNVNKKGYLFYSDNFLVANRKNDSTYEKNISLTPIELNAAIVLKNIFFDVNKYELKATSQIELDKLILLLNDNPSIKIEVSGHTDNVGKLADNLLLSNNRAKAVVNYLISKKIDPKRLIAKGYGATKPITDNKNEDNRAQNRRTEIKVISR
jgi:outer membrane protein OmpA-like peptidoglycan-associated protein/tetratricopeptide (TPR) repeat protein